MTSASAITADDQEITALVQAVLTEQPYAGRPLVCGGPTDVVLRRRGQRRQTYWLDELDLEALLNGIIEQAIATLRPASQADETEQSNSPAMDTIELCLTHSYRRVQPAEFDSVFANIHRGVRGIELQYQGRVSRYSPTRMIAANLSFQKVVQQFLDQESISAQTFLHQGGTIQVFEARQVLIHLLPQVTVTTLHRGNRIVPLEKLCGAVLTDMTQAMGQWLLRQVQVDGRMVYKYFPSRGEESTANNLIRQFMATLALIRYARFTRQDAHKTLATHNLRYNLSQFYRQEGSLGFVEYDGKVKLGAIALAALAILEYTDLEGTGGVSQSIASPYEEIFHSLCRTIDHLWQPDGSFHTFYKPGDRNDNQNFYPGEALLFWAALYQHTHDHALLQRCYTSFAYYRDWHRQQRNPAFIPWHTQAYTLLYKETGDRQFLDFILEMNDWLVPMQQWDSAPYPDVQGRFYNPDYLEYGPPHASSTGVYLEGLIDAYQLAVEADDSDRARVYQTVIWRGLRSIRQLQFRDAVDLFYVSNVAAVQGGVRTTVYDNGIRVDNVQHCLMALLKLMTLPGFAQSDSPVCLDLPQRPGDCHPLQPAQPLALKPQTITEGKARYTLKNFTLLEANVDLQPFLAELETHTQLWLHDTSRQNHIKVQRETQTIHLRSAVKPLPPGIDSINDVQESRPTAMATHFPAILAWVEQRAIALGGELGRVAVVRLAPGGRVYRHVDHGMYYQWRDRYHLVLHSPAGSLLGAGEEWLRMQPGELWWFNNKAPHEACNESNDWRIHLIFDVRR